MFTFFITGLLLVSTVSGHANISTRSPIFSWIKLPNSEIKIKWLSKDNQVGAPSEFYVSYRERGTYMWQDSTRETIEDHIILSSLKPDTDYEVQIAVIEGNYHVQSQLQIVRWATQETTTVSSINMGDAKDKLKQLMDNSEVFRMMGMEQQYNGLVNELKNRIDAMDPK